MKNIRLVRDITKKLQHTLVKIRGHDKWPQPLLVGDNVSTKNKKFLNNIVVARKNEFAFFKYLLLYIIKIHVSNDLSYIILMTHFVTLINNIETMRNIFH